MASRNKDLFIGITSWNSELFLGTCLAAIEKTTAHINKDIVVFDNNSTDDSVQIARDHGARVIIDKQTQPNALNILLNESNAQYSLFMHADTILLSKKWFALCSNKIDNHTVLVSPEDIGCGPMTRDFGVGQPESSFLFFDTEAAKQLRQWRVIKRRFYIPLILKKQLDLYGKHVTHNLSKRLEQANLNWFAMSVLASNLSKNTLYSPKIRSRIWLDEMGKLEYGLGNFYAIDGEITHYHNWYERLFNIEYFDSPTTEPNGQGFEYDFIKSYTNRFIKDYENNNVNLPNVS